MPRYLQDKVHTDFSTGSAVWSGYHDQITGGYLTTGAAGGYVDWDNHLMREYNRKIDTFSGAWGAAQAEDLILNPHDAGFRYTGTGYFKWDQYSVDFDGVDDYANCGAGVGDTLGNNYAGSLTVSLWFKADDPSRSYDGIFDIGPFDENGGRIWIQLHDNKLKFWLDGFEWNRFVAFTDSASWHHLAVVYAVGSATNSKMYLDGASVGAIDGTYDTFPSTSDMDFAGLKTIIGSYYSTDYPFKGNIDEVAVFDSALSATQVAAIYNGGTPQSLADSGPIGWWRMGDGDTYPTLQDSSANNFTGTMINMTSADIVADTP